MCSLQTFRRGQETFGICTKQTHEVQIGLKERELDLEGWRSTGHISMFKLQMASRLCCAISQLPDFPGQVSVFIRSLHKGPLEPTSPNSPSVVLRQYLVVQCCGRAVLHFPRGPFPVRSPKVGN